MAPSHPTYLDWAAAAVPDPEAVQEARERSLRSFANPSSPHLLGRAAEDELGSARERLARCLGCGPREVVFTSGGTEANNLVLFSLLARRPGKSLVLSGIEHASVYEPALVLGRMGFPVHLVPAGPDGLVDPRRVAGALDESTALVALMLVNNETGAVQPVEEAARLVRERADELGRRIHLHTDAVQAFGRIPFNPGRMGVDSASLSAHKLGGPRGVGALYLRRESPLEALYRGGGQEFGLRPGTENVPGACAMALAAEKRLQGMPEETGRARELAAFLLDGLRDLEAARIIPVPRGADAPGGGERGYVPHIINVSFPPVPGEVLVRVLEEKGVLVSTGAACSSRKKSRFRVLENMGVPGELSASAIRISTGYATRREDVERLVGALKREIPKLIRITPA